jgi:hypothetical protein
VPDALALPLWKGLLEEISVAQKVAISLFFKFLLRLLPLIRTSSQSGDAEYQLNTLLLLCPVVACDDGSPFYMRGEEEVFCSNSDVQFTFEGAIVFQFFSLALKCLQAL